ncbi:MAG TPA: hypothetical protein DGT23_25465 [Micromonosporaceae bacterium]|nr:hypothetical protein [Micromonosporaceae bacterium]
MAGPLDDIEAAIAVCLRDRSLAALVVLGRLDDPRAVGLLLQCVRFRDWRVRCHAVHGLAWRDDRESINAVERAAREDCALAVRVAALQGVARRDPARAKTLYIGLLDHPHLTPMLREQVIAALEK